MIADKDKLLAVLNRETLRKKLDRLKGIVAALDKAINQSETARAFRKAYEEAEFFYSDMDNVTCTGEVRDAHILGRKLGYALEEIKPPSMDRDTLRKKLDKLKGVVAALDKRNNQTETATKIRKLYESAEFFYGDSDNVTCTGEMEEVEPLVRRMGYSL